MTRTAIYDAKENTLVEQPEMKQPEIMLTNDFYSSDYHPEVREYNAHLATLRTIPCSPECRGVFENGKVYEEGRDYEIKVRCTLNCEMCLIILQCEKCKQVAIAVNSNRESETKTWEEVFLKMHQKAQHFVSDLGFHHPGLPNHKPWHEKMISELQKEYTITKK